MDLALRLGVERFYQYMEKFGLGQKTGLDVAGEASGILMAKKFVKNVDLARMGFGHAIALTPIQLISAVASIVNGGTFNSPHFVNYSSSLNVKNTSRKVENIISYSTCHTVNGLLEFAENKQGKYTFVEGYNVGGKTGTAQKYKESGGIDQGKYISSFVGTYPADNPKYLLFVMVDEPSAGAYYGSIVAAPYGKEIFTNLFDYLGEEKQDENARTEYVEMPNVVGMSLADCLSLLKSLNIDCEIEGEGEYIENQLPPEGTKIAKGSVILLTT